MFVSLFEVKTAAGVGKSVIHNDIDNTRSLFQGRR